MFIYALILYYHISANKYKSKLLFRNQFTKTKDKNFTKDSSRGRLIRVQLISILDEETSPKLTYEMLKAHGLQSKIMSTEIVDKILSLKAYLNEIIK